MEFIYNKPTLSKEIADLREAVGWSRMESSYSNPLLTSYYHISVYDGSALIDYIDCVSNGVTDAYIQDLMIHPNYQKHGIGTKLMNDMLAYLKSRHIFMISVIFEEGLRPFYERFGFCSMLSGQMQTDEIG